MQRRTWLAGSLGATAAISGLFPGGVFAAGESKRKRIRVGQIGTAHSHASGKMEAVRRLSDDWEVVGLVEPDSSRRKAAERIAAFRDVPLMTEEQLLNQPELEVVNVETEIDALTPTAHRCVQAGKHVHVDKPPGESLKAFHALWDTAVEKKVVVQVGYMFRHHPAIRFCLDAVRGGWLGEPFEVTAVIGKLISPEGRKELVPLRGGIMYELGCHLVDLAVAVLGKPDRVTAHVRRVRSDLDPLPDNQLAVLEYPKATATVRATAAEPHGGERRQLVVCGTEGVVEIHPLEPAKVRLALEKPRDGFRAGYQDVPLPLPTGRYDGDFRELAAIVRGEKQVEFDRRHDLASMEAVLRGSGLPVDEKS